MSEPAKTPKKIDLVEIAKKKRHVALVEKVSKGISLNGQELRELQQFERGDAPPGTARTEEEVARHFGVSTRTVQYWKKDAMPVCPDGTYDLEAISEWRLTKIQERSPDSSDRAKWESEYRKNKALMAEIQLKKELGQLVTRDEVEEGRVRRILTIKKALLSLPPRLAPQVVNVDVKTAEAIIRKRIEEIISDFARGGEGLTEAAAAG